MVVGTGERLDEANARVEAAMPRISQISSAAWQQAHDMFAKAVARLAGDDMAEDMRRRGPDVVFAERGLMEGLLASFCWRST